MKYPVTVMNEPCNRVVPVKGVTLNELLADFLNLPFTLDATSWLTVGVIAEKMEKLSYHMVLKSPYAPGGDERWWAGFTPYLVSGWNGIPDFYASAPTGPLAVARAAVLWHLESPNTYQRAMNTSGGIFSINDSPAEFTKPRTI